MRMNKELGEDFFANVLDYRNSNETIQMFEKFNQIMCWYGCAIREVRTKLEVLNDEFQSTTARNPIDNIKSRIKKPLSIYEKLQRRGFPVTMDSILTNMHDVAGIRVICPFIDDIYTVADMLIAQDDITLIQRKDYIKNPKENGYRSLHLVVEVPIFLSTGKQMIKVEVQIRTIAMNFWASLEHQIHYKKSQEDVEDVVSQLTDCANVIYETDMKMQEIRKQLEAEGKLNME
ncbi:MAG: GTP pyrophosphokinase family protein [Lachnospiraceae bacterium]|nr:GTP pyrophosphokinase family protein [Lachnospiraceae bacterium]